VTRIGRYEVLGRIALTDSAAIYLARRYGPHGFEQLVVLKQLRDDRADEETVTMFLDEARILAKLSHPNVARALDLEEIDGVRFIAMEHVDGPSLRELLRASSLAGTGRLPLVEALAIAFHLAEALVYLHSRTDELGEPLDLVHRDLKPENVVVSFDGVVKLIDFSIARASSKVLVTRTGVVKGTPGYMPPEQLRGDAVDRRADVYALGALLHELIAGELPAEARSTRLRDRVAGIEHELDELVARCTTADKAARPEAAEVRDALAASLVRRGAFPTSSDLRATVRALISGADTTRADPTAVPRFTHRRSLPRAFAISLGVALVIGAGLAAYFLGTLLSS
jgi:serine/threonine protein kinase